MNIGLAVKIAREQQGMTAKLLAERAKLSQSAISLIENGERDMLLSTASAIAKALGISINDLELLAEKAEAIQAKIEGQQRRVNDLRSELINDLLVSTLNLKGHAERATKAKASVPTRLGKSLKTANS